MEASQAAQPDPAKPADEAKTEAAEGGTTVVGESFLEPDDHQPIGGDAQGTVTPKSAPPAQSLPGEVR